MIIELLASMALLQSSACNAPQGTEQLWAKPATRLVIVGEIHGTVEAPAAFSRMVCAAAESRPVVVALEYEDTAQSAVDAWMSSDGGPAAHARLLESVAFTRRFEDGRSSTAMLNLFENLRLLKANGNGVTVVAFRPSTDRPAGFSQAYSELAMAQQLSQMVQDHPQALSLVLVGRFHASKSAFGALTPAAAHLPSAEVISIQLNIQGGQMWTCTGNGSENECGPNDAGGEDNGERGVILEQDPDARFDGRLSIGPLSSSPPAQLSSVDHR